MERDLELKALEELLDLTERLCQINPEQGLRVQILLYIIEWASEKLIFRKHKSKENRWKEESFLKTWDC